MLVRLWGMRREFAKYFIIGISGLALDVASLYLLKEMAHLSATVAVVINQAFLLNYVFFLNKYWAFKSKGITQSQMVRFYTVAGINYGISILWMWFFTEFWRVDLFLGIALHYAFFVQKGYLIVRIVNVAVAVAWNFLLYKFWVYREPVQSDKSSANG